MTVTLEPIRCADSVVPPGWLYRPEAHGSRRKALGIGVRPADWISYPVGANLVTHPQHGPILIDCGLSTRATLDLAADFGRFNAWFWRRLHSDPSRSLANQLCARGLEPEQIELAVMTHLHVDHASGATELPRANFVCSTREWAASQARLGVFAGYVHRQLPARERVRLIDFDSQSSPYGPFDQSVDLLGDGSVRLLFTPGHSLGHLSVLLQLAQRQALLIGDALFTLRNLREDVPPFRTADETAYQRSVGQIRAFARQCPDALLLPTHDEEAWRDLEGLGGS